MKITLTQFPVTEEILKPPEKVRKQSVFDIDHQVSWLRRTFEIHIP